MENKSLIIFMPSIEEGGVEKNLFLISNYLIKKINNISIITTSKNKKKYFNKKINFISPRSNYWQNQERFPKTIICLFLLIKFFFEEKNILVFAFQANVYAIIVCKILNIPIITRSNTSASGWSKNFFKRFIFKNFFVVIVQINIIIFF